MSTPPVSGTSGTSGASSTDLSQAIGSSNQLDQQAFLKLLITQLSNQDPMSPQDDQQFLAQMAQFSTVEGVNNLGSTMNKLQGASLVGKTVEGQVISNGVPQPVSGVVSSVQFQTDGVHFTVNGQDLTLDQLTKVDG